MDEYGLIVDGVLIESDWHSIAPAEQRAGCNKGQ